MSNEANRRRQYLLQPLLQIKVGLYHLLLAVCFVVTLVGVLHAQWMRFRNWLQLTELRDVVDTTVMVYVQSTLLWVGMATLIFLVAGVVITILSTHRMVGPTVAFQRHIEALTAGDYEARTTLRPHDAFHEVADALNTLSETLARRHGGADAAEAPEPAPSPGPA